MQAGKPEASKLAPVYSLAEAARLIGGSASTLRHWFYGRAYAAGSGVRFSEPVLFLTHEKGQPLSFLELVEAHALLGLRKHGGMPLGCMRRAVDYLRRTGGDPHFLASAAYRTNGRDLFLDAGGALLSLAEQGQVVQEELPTAGLPQVDYGYDGYAQRFYPEFRECPPRFLVLDPSLNAGELSLARLQLPLRVIAERLKRGESITTLAHDCGAGLAELETAVAAASAFHVAG